MARRSSPKTSTARSQELLGTVPEQPPVPMVAVVRSLRASSVGHRPMVDVPNDEIRREGRSAVITSDEPLEGDDIIPGNPTSAARGEPAGSEMSGGPDAPRGSGPEDLSTDAGSVKLKARTTSIVRFIKISGATWVIASTVAISSPQNSDLQMLFGLISAIGLAILITQLVRGGVILCNKKSPASSSGSGCLNELDE